MFFMRVERDGMAGFNSTFVQIGTDIVSVVTLASVSKATSLPSASAIRANDIAN